MSRIPDLNVISIIRSVESGDPSTVLKAVNEANLGLYQKQALLTLIIPVLNAHIPKETLNTLKKSRH